MSSASSLTALSLSFALLAGSACAAHADLSASALADSASPSAVSDVETSALPVAPQSDAAGVLGKSASPTATPSVPLDGGKLYYFEQGINPGYVHELAPDGTGDRVVTGISSDNTMIATRASRLLHNGQRWFLYAKVENGGAAFFPDGRPLFEMYTTTEGGSPLKLTDNGSACISMYGPRGVYLDWAPNAAGLTDGAASWVGRRWADAGNGGSPCDTAADAGVFRTGLTYDGAGNVVGIAAQPTTPELVVNAETFAWRPGGQQIAYAANFKLFLAPDPTGIGQFAVNYVSALAWSPGGTKIAIAGGNDGTYTVNPNNTGLTLLAAGRTAKRSGQSSLIHRSVDWSPNGTHLVYTEYESWYGTSNYTYRLRRMTASGAGNTVLPAAGPKGGFAMGWGGN
jgi:WD40 repeat protein